MNMGFYLRSIRNEFRFQFRRNMARPTYVFMMFVNPLLFTVLLYFLANTRDPVVLAQKVVAGAGLVGMWSAVLFSSAADIVREKEQGMFEYLVAADTDLRLIMLGKILTSACITFLSLVQSYLYTSLFAGTLLPLHHAGFFLLALVLMIFSLVGLSMTIATLFALSKIARTFQNLLEYPLFLISGLVLPVSVLPAWIRAISMLLPTTWGATALRSSMAVELNGGEIGLQLGMTFGIGTVFFLISLYLFRVIERRLLVDGTMGDL